MSTKYQEYLAAHVLDGGEPVTYRSLSRALKVHVNAAKEMLYDFEQSQNSRNPSSIHATYLVCGIPNLTSQPQVNGSGHLNDEDTIMHDGSFTLSSSLPDPADSDASSVPVLVFSLVGQERLSEIKLSYKKISSIHIYSLEPGRLNNVHILSECNDSVASVDGAEDPLQKWKTYGTIYNPFSKRRATHQPRSLNAAPQVASTAGMKPSTSAAVASSLAKPAEAPVHKPATTDAGQPKSRSQKIEHSALFKSIGNSVKNQSKEARKETERDPDEPMDDAPLESEDDGEEDEGMALTKDAIGMSEVSGKAKADREAELLKMMDEDSDQESETKNVEEIDEEGITEPLTGNLDDEDEDDDAGAAVDIPPPHQSRSELATEEQSQITTADGRRRGRRRVMKKKTTKDADGYLVTREEPAWESFSEDDTSLQEKPKSSTSAAASLTSSNKAKKSNSTTKAGQGNIMSFFGKR